LSGLAINSQRRVSSSAGKSSRSFSLFNSGYALCKSRKIILRVRSHSSLILLSSQRSFAGNVVYFTSPRTGSLIVLISLAFSRIRLGSNFLAISRSAASSFSNSSRPTSAGLFFEVFSDNLFRAPSRLRELGLQLRHFHLQ